MTTIVESDIESEEKADFYEGDFIRLKDWDTRTLEFIPGREKVVTTTYLGQQTMKMEYIVRDAKRRSIRREKKFQLTRNHAKKVGNELKAGHTILELTRKGNDKDTEYEIKVIK